VRVEMNPRLAVAAIMRTMRASSPVGRRYEVTRLRMLFALPT